MDLNHHTEAGTRAVEKALKHFPDIPLLMLSNTELTEEEVSALSAHYYAVKSFDWSELIETIDMALDQDSMIRQIA